MKLFVYVSILLNLIRCAAPLSLEAFVSKMRSFQQSLTVDELFSKVVFFKQIVCTELQGIAIEMEMKYKYEVKRQTVGSNDFPDPISIAKGEYDSFVYSIDAFLSFLIRKDFTFAKLNQILKIEGKRISLHPLFIRSDGPMVENSEVKDFIEYLKIAVRQNLLGNQMEATSFMCNFDNESLFDRLTRLSRAVNLRLPVSFPENIQEARLKQKQIWENDKFYVVLKSIYSDGLNEIYTGDSEETRAISTGYKSANFFINLGCRLEEGQNVVKFIAFLRSEGLLARLKEIALREFEEKDVHIVQIQSLDEEEGDESYLSDESSAESPAEPQTELEWKMRVLNSMLEERSIQSRENDEDENTSCVIN